MAKAPTFTNIEDRHFVFNATHHQLKCFKSNGELEWHIRAHGEGTGGAPSKHLGNTPSGLYRVGEVVATPHDNRFGPYEIKLDVVELDNGVRRGQIGIHGGGSDLLKPFAAEQGWEKTHGCIRVQNHDLGLIVNKVRGVQGKRGQVWVTVQW